MTGDVYLAGLWKKILCRGLMWQIESPAKFRPIYHVPTWSWLSTGCPIYYFNNKEEVRALMDAYLVEILEAETVLAGADTTGAISGGIIKLRGQMMQGRLREAGKFFGIDSEKNLQTGIVVLDLEWEVVEAINGPLWCLRLIEDQGLLLKPCGNNFQRVGVFYMGSRINSQLSGEMWFRGCEPCTITLV